MANATLRFRRHLALCALLLLVKELYLAGQVGVGVGRLRAVAAVELLDSQQQASRVNTSVIEGLVDEDAGAKDYDYDEVGFFGDLLTRIGYYLPTLNFNFTLVGKRFENGQLDWEVEQYYEERFARNTTLDQLYLLAIKAAIRMAPMPLHTSWGYQSREDLRVSSWPVASEQRCAAHLHQLARRLDRLQAPATGSPGRPDESGEGAPEVAHAALHESTPVENFEAQALYKSKDLQFARYLDTFGRVPSDLLRGNVRWYGSHSGCMSTRLGANQQLGGAKRIKFRYCLAALTSKAWPTRAKGATGKFAADLKSRLNQTPAATTTLSQTTRQQSSAIDYGSTLDVSLENFFIRVGACLPESCDSSALDYQENTRIIERLIKFNLMKPFNSDHYYLSDLYCLPDQRSPLREVPILGKLLILAAFAWMALIALATTVHLNVERFYTKAVREIRARQSEHKTGSSGSASGAGSANFVGIPPTSERVARDRDGAEKQLNQQQQQQQQLRRASLDNNEYRESDILQLKRNWIRFNVYLFDESKRLIEGVDFIACLSLYSNWLKYTKRLKLAVAQLHADEERRERIQARNQQLVEAALMCNATSGANTRLATGGQIGSGERKQRIENMANVRGLMDASGNKAANVSGANSESKLDERHLESSESVAEEASGFNRELAKRIVEQDYCDEIESDTLKRRVDTSSLNALKVIALVWIIAGHCIFFLGSTVSNGAILMNYVRDMAAFALANGALYITELFFVVTGCLTAYLAFKYNTFEHGDAEMLDTGHTNKARRLSSPAVSSGQYLESRMFKISFWIKIVINRYLRILPTYLVVYAFVKLVSVYVGGSGQIWDYAVSQNSMRRRCVQESWLPVLTLTSNFLDVYSHCLVGGWYLSVDMQFMIMAVPLLIVLARCQRRGNSLKAPTSGSAGSGFGASSLAEKEKQKREQALTGGQQLTFIGDSARFNDTQALSAPRKLQNQIQLTKRISLAYLTILSAALVSISLAVYSAINHSHVDLSYILRFVPHTVATLSQNIALYTNSIYRLRAFAFGLILGHTLYLYEFKLIKLPKFVQQHGAKLTTIIFTVGFCIMFAPAIYPKSKLIVSHDMVALLMILTASAVDIVICVLIFLVCVGKAPKAVLFFLNSPFWTVLSSLSLCAFLVHQEVIVLLTSQLNPPPTCQYSLLLFIFSATLLITYMLALALYLSFEMPFGRLVDAVMRKYFMNSPSVRSDKPSDAL